MVFSGLLPLIGGDSSPYSFGEFLVLLVPPGLLPPLLPPSSPPPLPLPLSPLLVPFSVSCLLVLIDEKMEPVAPVVAVAEPVLAMTCEMSEKKGTEVEMVWFSESSDSE